MAGLGKGRFFRGSCIVRRWVRIGVCVCPSEKSESLPLQGPMATLQSSYEACERNLELNIPIAQSDWKEFCETNSSGATLADLPLNNKELQDLDGHISRMGLGNLRAKVGYASRAIRWTSDRITLVSKLEIQLGL